MSLACLPDELVMVIMKQLDLYSLYNFYTAYDRIRDIICTYGVIKRCNLSRCTMAKTETLKLRFFKDISRHLQDLNVCGMFYLYKTVLVPVMKKLQCLNTLDVTYTNININDLLQIYNACPTLKDISINFLFGKTQTKLQEVTLSCPDIYVYQNLFKNFWNVHFVGNLHILMYSHLPILVLNKAKLKKLQYTIIDCDPTHNPLKSKDKLQFDSFTVHIINTKIQMPSACLSRHLANQHDDIESHGYLNQMSPFDVLNFSDYEVIIINRKHCLTKPVCYASHIFENFFGKYCDSYVQGNVEFNITNHFDVSLYGTVCIMLWKKSITKFDQKFFSNLWHKLKPLLPCHFDSSIDAPVIHDYNLYVTVPQEIEHKSQSLLLGLKRKRQGPPTCVLDYDSAFEEKNKVQLTLMFESNIKCAVTLSSSCDYLRKLTFLSLSGHIRYGMDFFNILFRCCDHLVTLSVKANACCSCYAAISKYLPLNKTIKNFQLIDRSIDFPTLFCSMSQCKLLENVHIFDTSDTTSFSNPTIMLDKLENLYCMYLYIYSSCSAKKRYMQILKQANLSSQKRAIVKLHMNNYLICDPYSDVFKLNLI